MRVQDPCIGVDSVCFDQNCSCIISIVYFEELGSLRMLCVHDEFFRMLYCRIAMVLMGSFSVMLGRLLSFVPSLLICALPHRGCCIRCAMLSVHLHSLCSWCRWCNCMYRGLHFHSFRTSVCFCGVLPDGQTCSTCSTA